LKGNQVAKIGGRERDANADEEEEMRRRETH